MLIRQVNLKTWFKGYINCTVLHVKLLKSLLVAQGFKFINKYLALGETIIQSFTK